MPVGVPSDILSMYWITINFFIVYITDGAVGLNIEKKTGHGTGKQPCGSVQRSSVLKRDVFTFYKKVRKSLNEKV